jgi:uncharacterized membrane protein
MPGDPPADEIVGNRMKALADEAADRVERDGGRVMSNAERGRAYRNAVLAVIGSIVLGLLVALVLYVLDR